MTIQEIQMKMIRERVVDSLLRKGIVPSSEHVEKEVARCLSKIKIGEPIFKRRLAIPNEKSSVDDYNNMFAEIKEDLIVSYELLKEISNQVMAAADYYDISRTRLNRKIHKLELLNERIEQSKLLDKTTTVVGDDFGDYTKIEFIGDEKRNIPATTAFVDLISGAAELIHEKSNTTRYNLSDSKVSFTVNKGEIEHLSPINSIKEESMYDAWRAVVKSKDDSGMTGEVTIEMKETCGISKVVIHMQSGRKLSVMLEVSTDGMSYNRLEERRINSVYQWSLNNKKARFIRFKITHDEPTNGNGGYFDYSFGIKKVDVMIVSHVPNAVFVSKPHTIDNLRQIESVKLDVEDVRHPGTDIRYYYGVDDGETMIEWNEIEKGVEFDTGDVETLYASVDKFSTDYGKVALESFGQKYYSIFSLPGNATLEGTKIRMARNMWLKEIIPAPLEINEIEDNSDIATYQTGPQDWIRNSSSFKAFINVNNRKDYLSTNYFHRYTTYIYSEVDTEIEGKFYTSNNNPDVTESSWCVYINGEKSKGRTNKNSPNINTSYKLGITKGWNTIQVYAYSKEESEQINLDFYEPDLEVDIYGVKENLTEVSLYDLINNSTTRTLTRFAIQESKDSNGKSMSRIIVNYNPRQLDLMPVFSSVEAKGQRIIAGDGIEYEISYKTTEEPKTEDIKVRLMAVLKRDSEIKNVSPSIRKYSLEVK